MTNYIVYMRNLSDVAWWIHNHAFVVPITASLMTLMMIGGKKVKQ